MAKTKTTGTTTERSIDQRRTSSERQISTDSSESSSNGLGETTDLSSPVILPSYRKIIRNRPYSATLRGQTLLHEKTSIIKEIVNRRHPWESDEYLYQTDSNEPLTKSALIYRLMRSRLEANLAKSISASRDRSNQKKKIPSSTAHFMMQLSEYRPTSTHTFSSFVYFNRTFLRRINFICRYSD